MWWKGNQQKSGDKDDHDRNPHPHSPPAERSELHLIRRNPVGLVSSSVHEFAPASSSASSSSTLQDTSSNTRVPHPEGHSTTIQFHRETGHPIERNAVKKSASKSSKPKSILSDTNTQRYSLLRNTWIPESISNSAFNSHTILPGSRKSTLNIDPKKFMIGTSPKRDVIGGSNYSRSILLDARTLTQGPAPDYLRYLADVDHLFFKSCNKFPPEIRDFNPKQKRGLWNAAGRCVYYLGLTDSYTFRKFRSGFTYKVVDYLGTPVLTSRGSQWNFGFRGCVSVTLNDGFLLGTMEQDFLGSNYSVKDGQGRVVLTIQAPCYLPAVPYILWCCKEEFEICMDDGISEIGKISRSWDDEYPDFDGDLGIEFESADDNRVKALLLGVYFLVEFQYYKGGGNGVTYFFCLATLLIAVSFILSNGFGYYPQLGSFLIQPPSVES